MPEEHLPGCEPSSDDIEQLPVVPLLWPHQHDLARLGEEEVDRQQHLAERSGRAGEQRPERTE